MSRPIAPRPPGRRGTTLIEVLVAMLLLSFGLMGMLGLKAVALKQGGQSNARAVASVVAADMLDRLRANPVRATAGAYNLALDAPTPGASSAIAATDLRQWRLRLAQTLPAGTGSVAVQPDGRVRIVVRWNERTETGATPASLQFAFEARL